MPDQTTPVADASPAIPQAASADTSNTSKGRDRFAGLVQQAEQAKRSRDQVLSLLEAERQKTGSLETAIGELKTQIASLSQAVQTKKSASPFVDYADADEQQLIALGTSGGTDPISGQPVPPNPVAAMRAGYELARRTAKAEAAAAARAEFERLRDQVDTRDRTREAMANAERRIAATFGAEAADANSSLRKMVERAYPTFAQEYGEAYARSPEGLRHLFSESRRLLDADALAQARTELAKLRAEAARRAGAAYGADGPPAPPSDEMREALKNRSGRSGVRDAISKMKTLPGRPMQVIARPVDTE